MILVLLNERRKKSKGKDIHYPLLFRFDGSQASRSRARLAAVPPEKFELL